MCLHYFTIEDTKWKLCTVYFPVHIFYVLLLSSVLSIFSVIWILHMVLNFACLNFVRAFYLHCHYFNIHNCNSDGNSTANRVIYSRQQLSQSYNVKTNATSNKVSHTGCCLENLAPVNWCSYLSPSSTLLKFCLFNARSIINKTLRIKDYIVD